MADRGHVTGLLIAWSQGDPGAVTELMPVVYGELRRLAKAYLKYERPDHTLQTSALVHEAYLRLIDQKRVDWRNRTHFYGIAAQMMRRILVDHARKQSYAKRGGGLAKVPLETAIVLPVKRAPELLALDEALNSLSSVDAEQAKIVELRFFGGLNGQEIADVLGISSATVSRRWRAAKAWLYHQLGEASM